MGGMPLLPRQQDVFRSGSTVSSISASIALRGRVSGLGNICDLTRKDWTLNDDDQGAGEATASGPLAAGRTR